MSTILKQKILKLCSINILLEVLFFFSWQALSLLRGIFANCHELWTIFTRTRPRHPLHSETTLIKIPLLIPLDKYVKASLTKAKYFVETYAAQHGILILNSHSPLSLTPPASLDLELHPGPLSSPLASPSLQHPALPSPFLALALTYSASEIYIIFQEN